MAHIILRPAEGEPASGPRATQLIINGCDFSNEVFREGIELVEVGSGPDAEVGFRVTLAVSRLDLGGDEDVQVTDHFRGVAQRVHSVSEVDA